MKIYDTPLAPNPRRVRWVMAEKGIDDIEVVTLNIFEGQHKTPEYLRKAGLANVPMLELDDGTCASSAPSAGWVWRTPVISGVATIISARRSHISITAVSVGVRPNRFGSG